MSCKEDKPYHSDLTSQVKNEGKNVISNNESFSGERNVKEPPACFQGQIGNANWQDSFRFQQAGLHPDLSIAAASPLPSAALFIPNDTVNIIPERCRKRFAEDTNLLINQNTAAAPRLSKALLFAADFATDNALMRRQLLTAQATLDTRAKINDATKKFRVSQDLHTPGASLTGRNYDPSEFESEKRRRICSTGDLTIPAEAASKRDEFYKTALIRETTIMRSRLQSLIGSKKIASNAADELVAPSSLSYPPSNPTIHTRNGLFERSSKGHQTQGTVASKGIGIHNMAYESLQDHRLALAEVELKKLKSRLIIEQQMLKQAEYLARKNLTRPAIINELTQQHHMLFAEFQQQQQQLLYGQFENNNANNHTAGM